MMPTNLGLFITNGMTISIKSMGGSYICANPNNSVSLSPQCKDWETWTVEQVGNCYALKSYHNTYLRANPNKSVDLSPQIKSWELWNIVKYGVTFALRSNAFGTYLRVNQINLVDLAVQCKEWELWEIVEQKPQLNFLPCAPPLPLQMAQLYNPVPTRNFTQIQQQKFPSHNYYMMPQFASMNTNSNTIPQNHQQVFIPPIQTNQLNFNPFQEQKMFSSAFQPYQSFQQISIPQKTHPIQPKENPSLQNQPHFQMPPLQQQNRYQNIRLYNGRLITFKSFHGTFLSCDHLGNITVSPNCGEWERWTVEHHGNRYSFKSCHGTYLHADPNLTINMSYICDEWDKWTLEYINCNYYLLKSAHETYLRAEVNGSVTLSNFDGFYEQWIIS